ncbi:Mannose-P-dolichol utilization defect 1 protein [Halotydeus destructor]|nr:Mannose-P-dolichol utilization defect 1 protein [Halotydeus destructor]
MTTDQVYYLLSLSTTAICVVLKLPQILTIISNKSVDGLSTPSLMLEFWSYLTTVSYSIYFDYPFGLYSEYPFLLIQDVLILILIINYEDRDNTVLRAFIPTAVAIHLTIGLKLVPKWLPVVALSCSSPVGVLSKGLQLYEIISKKDAGHVSPTSWLLNCISSLCRLLSYCLSVADKTLVISLTFSTALNLAVALAAKMYQKPLRPKTE